MFWPSQKIEMLPENASEPTPLLFYIYTAAQFNVSHQLSDWPYCRNQNPVIWRRSEWALIILKRFPASKNKSPISVTKGLNLPVDHFNSIGLVSPLRVRLRCLLSSFREKNKIPILDKIEIEFLLHAWILGRGFFHHYKTLPASLVGGRHYEVVLFPNHSFCDNTELIQLSLLIVIQRSKTSVSSSILFLWRSLRL
jgi:hypothetical protein